jgi:hypothetical protein
MLGLQNFTILRRQAYHALPAPTAYDPDDTRRVAKTTLVIHRYDCRIVAERTDTQDWGQFRHDYYASQLAALTDNGITGGTIRSSAIWRGCRICGTAGIADADWKEAAAALRVEHRAADKRKREQDEARWAVESARRDLDRAVADARNKVIAAILASHSNHLADAEDAARTRWIDKNPEQAALIGLIPAGDAEASETTVRFQPEAWINDSAVPVDAEGDVEWTVSSNTATSIGEALERGSDLDFVRYDRYAPDWIREWSGPFTVKIVGD